MNSSTLKYNCHEAYSRIDDFLDRELTEEEIIKVREHLDFCLMCASEFKFEGDVIQLIRAKLKQISAPPELLAKISLSLSASQS